MSLIEACRTCGKQPTTTKDGSFAAAWTASNALGCCGVYVEGPTSGACLDAWNTVQTDERAHYPVNPVGRISITYRDGRYWPLSSCQGDSNEPVAGGLRGVGRAGYASPEDVLDAWAARVAEWEAAREQAAYEPCKGCGKNDKLEHRPVVHDIMCKRCGGFVDGATPEQRREHWNIVQGLPPCRLCGGRACILAASRADSFRISCDGGCDHQQYPTLAEAVAAWKGEPDAKPEPTSVLAPCARCGRAPVYDRDRDLTCPVCTGFTRGGPEATTEEAWNMAQALPACANCDSGRAKYIFFDGSYWGIECANCEWGTLDNDTLNATLRGWLAGRPMPEAAACGGTCACGKTPFPVTDPAFAEVLARVEQSLAELAALVKGGK